mmetsp:Transcript_7348/g.31212  ORF Transcript_7348/g.31212 Transcript_7348/m.31212 type:complete len:416 (-) Transcript_7348:267-1514(-)
MAADRPPPVAKGNHNWCQLACCLCLPGQGRRPALPGLLCFLWWNLPRACGVQRFRVLSQRKDDQPAGSDARGGFVLGSVGGEGYDCTRPLGPLGGRRGIADAAVLLGVPRVGRGHAVPYVPGLHARAGGADCGVREYLHRDVPRAGRARDGRLRLTLLCLSLDLPGGSPPLARLPRQRQHAAPSGLLPRLRPPHRVCDHAQPGAALGALLSPPTHVPCTGLLFRRLCRQAHTRGCTLPSLGVHPHGDGPRRRSAGAPLHQLCGDRQRGQGGSEEYHRAPRHEPRRRLGGALLQRPLCATHQDQAHHRRRRLAHGQAPRVGAARRQLRHCAQLRARSLAPDHVLQELRCRSLRHAPATPPQQGCLSAAGPHGAAAVPCDGGPGVRCAAHGGAAESLYVLLGGGAAAAAGSLPGGDA